MFQLDKAVDRWCKSINTRHYQSHKHISELKDHLYSEIETLMQTGMSAEEAFTVAVNNLGKVESLTREYTKNEHFFSKFCPNLLKKMIYNIQRKRENMLPKKIAAYQIGIALLFAALIIASSALLDGSKHSDTVLYLLIALWWIPFSLLRTKPYSAKSEFLCLKKKALSIIKK